VQRGGAQVQALLDTLQPDAGVAVLAWHADWCETCRTSIPALERCAHFPHCSIAHMRRCLMGFKAYRWA
jgi:hypothetical protein